MDMTIRQILTLLQSEYPQSFSGMDARTMALKVELWEREFNADNPNLVYAAIRTYMRTPERFAPSIGQVREIMNILTADEELPEQTAWAMVSAACRNGLYGYKAEFEKLPPAVQAAVGAPEQLKAWAMMDADTVESVVASNFMRGFKANKAREKARAALPPEMRNLVTCVADKMKLGGGSAGHNALPERKTEHAMLPPKLEPYTAIPKPNKAQEKKLTDAQSEYKPMSEEDWVKRRDDLMARLQEHTRMGK